MAVVSGLEPMTERESKHSSINSTELLDDLKPYCLFLFEGTSDSPE